MVDTGDAREYADAKDFTDGMTYIIAAETTHSVIERRNPETGKVSKRIAIGLEKVKLPLVLNSTSRVALEVAYGTNTAKWEGRPLKVKIVQQNVRGTTRPVLYFEPVLSSTLKGK